MESVTSVGPMDPKRILEISEMTTNVSTGMVSQYFWILQHTRNLQIHWRGKRKYGLRICQTI